MIRLLPLILFCLLLAASPAEAGPLVAAVGALVTKAAAAWTALGAATLGKFAIGAALQQTLLGLALSKISIMIRGKRQSVQGVKRRVETGGDKPQPVLLGHYAAAGHLIWSGSHGQDGKTPRAFYQDVVLLSVLPVTGLTGTFVNGARATLGTTPHPDYGLPVTDFRKGSQDYLWIRFYDGTQTAADPGLVARHGADAEFAWTADMIGRGCAYAVITTRGHQELWSGQPAQLLFEIDGIALYDQRQDSTAGGAGAQRLTDPATWTFSANPIAAAATILTAGLSWQGQHLYGPRWPRHMLPAANQLAALTACDLPTPGQDGTPEPMYRFGAELDLAMEPRAFVDELLAACAGDSAFCEGKFLIHVGPAGAPVAHFTDADCSIDHPQELDPFKGFEEVFNAASSTFPDPAQAWVNAPAPARYHPEWEAEDGGRKVASLRFPLVPWVSQVQRLEQSALADQRRGRVHRIVLTPRFGHIATLDHVAWTSARNAYAAKTFKVTSVRDLRSGFVELFLLEEDPDDYDPPALLPHTPDAPVRIEIPAQAVPGFVVLPWTGRDADGVDRRAGVRALWDPEAAEDVQLLRLSARLAGATDDGVSIPVADFARGERIVQDPLIPGETYELRARLVASRPTEWTAWLTVVVPAVYIDAPDLQPAIRADLARLNDWIAAGVTDLPGDLAGLAAGILAEAEARATSVLALADAIAAEATARIEELALTAGQLRSYRDQIRALIAQVVELAAADHLAREEIRRSLTLQLGDMGASFAEQIVLLAGVDQAAAIRLTTLEASSSDQQAQITQAEIAMITGYNALAALIAAVSVGNATMFDHSEVWYFDQAVDGWTGAPANPATTAGWLRPANGSNLLSPTGLAVDGAAYQQVRTRLRRIGAPVWWGVLWWAAAGEGWDAGRSLTIPEPVWDGGEAIVTFNAPWSGQIDRIRLDLIDNPDAVNSVEADWIAVGRPAPGASAADLLAERQARIDGDAALASDILALDARLNDAEGGLAAQAGATAALTTRTEATEAGLVAAADRLDVVEAEITDPETGLPGLALAIDTLSAEAAREDGSQLYQSQAIRALQSAVRALAAEGVEGAARGHAQTQGVRDYVAAASQQLTTRIDLTDAGVAILAEAVTLLQAAIPDLATAAALQALIVTVTQQGLDLASTATALTSLTSRIDDPATGLASKLAASAITDYYTKVQTDGVAVDAASGATTALASALTPRIEAVEDATGDLAEVVGTKADASVLLDYATKTYADDAATGAATTATTALESALTPQIEAVDQAVGDLAVVVDGKASAGAVEALTTRTEATEAGVATAADRLDAVEAEITDPDTGLAATAGALDSLTGNVTAQGTTLIAQGGRLTAVEAEVDDLWDDIATKAAATAVSDLGATVAVIDGKVSAQATALTRLGALSDAGLAETILRMAAESSPAGVLARIGLRALVGDSSDDTRVAALFLEALAGGESRVVVQADRFLVTDGSANFVLFEVSGGQIYLRADRIRLTGDTVVEGSFAVTGSMIANGAVSKRSFARISGLQSVTFANPKVLWQGAMALAPYVTDGSGRVLNPMLATVAGRFRPDVAVAGWLRLALAASDDDWVTAVQLYSIEVSWSAGQSGIWSGLSSQVVDMTGTGGPGDALKPGDIPYASYRVVAAVDSAAHACTLSAYSTVIVEQVSK